MNTTVARISTLLAAHGVVLLKIVDVMLENRVPRASSLIWFAANDLLGLFAGYMALHFAASKPGTNGEMALPYAEGVCRFSLSLNLVLLLFALWWTTTPH